MKITMNLAALTGEQVKFLWQLGMFRDEQTWEACDHRKEKDQREAEE